MTVPLPRPFFASPIVGDGATKVSRRLLLVSVAYPPSAEVGSLRWQKLAQAAFARGITTDVIMVDPLEPELREESRLTEVPPAARLYDVPIREIAVQRLQWMVRRIVRRTMHAGRPGRDEAAEGPIVGPFRNSGSLPAQMGRAYRAWAHYAQWEDWAKRAASLGADLASHTQYEAVVSSGPPHMAHEAARRIAEAAHCPLIIDLRDPWYSDDVEPRAMRSSLWRARASRYERQCVERSSLVVVNTDSCRSLMVERYPAMSDRFLTVMNGADADVASEQSQEKRFIISHAGSLYGGRTPRSLFRAVARVVRKLGLTPDDLGVRFMGGTTFHDVPLQTLAEEDGIGPFFGCESRRPRAEALALIRDSAMVAVLPQEFVHSIPGKVFEYVQLAAWPLVLTERGTATDALLRDTGADVVHPDDVDAIAHAIEQRYLAFRAGVRPTPINADGRFDRDRQAAKLLDAIDRLA
ncbi:MAG: hypothetical protein Q8K82_03895 [Gemmatimonadaceae bacterium]|nr:hypothetical protein [Gemmatimonadaceae bacterium]